ncbi:hypothetical protein HBB16_06350 [Pseudonocardia sp. MCCB 268]|nr:hypothetical protein [Pseudonocardia cytotoxica]
MREAAVLPERRAATLPYQLSLAEGALYKTSRDYKSEMNRAERLQRDRARAAAAIRSVSPLTVLQRRLASSPEVILARCNGGATGSSCAHRDALAGWRGFDRTFCWTTADADDTLDELAAEELSTLEEQVVDAATAAPVPLPSSRLRSQCWTARAPGTAGAACRRRPWRNELREPRRRGDVRRRRVVADARSSFTEHRDTLTYLVERITCCSGATTRSIHGGSTV